LIYDSPGSERTLLVSLGVVCVLLIRRGAERTSFLDGFAILVRARLVNEVNPEREQQYRCLLCRRLPDRRGIGFNFVLVTFMDASALLKNIRIVYRSHYFYDSAPRLYKIH